MVNITKDHIPFSTPNNRRPNIKMTPTTITVHGTGNKKSTARNERGWLTNPSNKRTASWHYVVDENHIIEAIPPNYVAWHAGDGNGQGNMASISIEMCESGNRELVLKRTQELVRYLMDKHNIRKVVRHYDWTKKNCPRILNTDGKWSGWFVFLSAIFNPVTNKEEPKVSKRDINVVSKWAEKDWKEAQENGYYDGSRPGASITREEDAIVTNRIRHNFLGLIKKLEERIEELESHLK